MAFQCGDMVVYGIHGVCRIVDVEIQKVAQKTVEYFVLEPVGQAEAKFFVPTHNPAAIAKLRKMLTREDMDRILDSRTVKDAAWIADESARKETYRSLISGGDCAELLRMLRVLYAHKQEQLAAGKKFHMCDENFMKDAERLVRSEVACVLGVSEAEANAYIHARLEQNV